MCTFAPAAMQLAATAPFPLCQEVHTGKGSRSPARPCLFCLHLTSPPPPLPRPLLARYWFSGKHLYIKMADPGAGDYRLMGRVGGVKGAGHAMP